MQLDEVDALSRKTADELLGAPRFAPKLYAKTSPPAAEAHADPLAGELRLEPGPHGL